MKIKIILSSINFYRNKSKIRTNWKQNRHKLSKCEVKCRKNLSLNFKFKYKKRKLDENVKNIYNRNIE